MPVGVRVYRRVTTNGVAHAGNFPRLTAGSGSHLLVGMTSWDRHSKVVAQASGMVSVQAECTVDDTLIRIQERAVSMDCTLDEIATAVIERRLRFSPP